MQVHKREGYLKVKLCSLTRQGKNCECHPACSFLFINKFGGYMLLFHQSTMRIIYCVWYMFLQLWHGSWIIFALL